MCIVGNSPMLGTMELASMLQLYMAVSSVCKDEDDFRGTLTIAVVTDAEMKCRLAYIYIVFLLVSQLSFK